MGITLVCPICGKSFIKKTGEYNRQLKKKPNHTFYYSPNCASVGVSEKERFLPFEKKCLYCKKSFITYPGIRERFYCSRSCASAGSVNENRRNAGKYAASVNFTPETHTTEVVAKRLYQREKYRYVELEKIFDRT